MKRLALLSIALLATLIVRPLLLSAASPPAEAVALLHQGKFRQVLHQLQAQPQASAYGLLGVAQAGTGQTAAAIQTVARAIAAGQTQDPLVFLAQAMIFHAQRQYDQAAAALEQTRRQRPDHPLVFLYLGLIHLNKRNYPAAENHLRQALALEPQLAHAHTGLGAVYQQQARIRHALTAYQQAAALDPGDARPHISLAAIYTDLALVGSAIQACQTALALDPDLHAVRTRLAMLLLQAGRDDQAVVMANALLQAGVATPQVYHVLANAQARQGRYKQAVAAAEQWTALTPAAVAAHTLLGHCHLAAANPQTARLAFQRALDLDPAAAMPALSLGIVEQAAGHPTQAQARYASVLPAVSPQTLRVAHFLLANLYLTQQQWDRAEHHLHRAQGVPGYIVLEVLDLPIYFSARTDSAAARVNLALLFQLKGWPAASLAACERVLAQQPEAPFALAIKARALARTDQHEQALAALQQLATLAPWAAGAHFEQAEIHLARNQPLQAITAYRQALALRPDDPSAHMRLARAYALADQNSRAIAAYKRVIELSPEVALGYNELAYHYARTTDNLDQALQLAQKALALAPDNGPVMDTLGWVHYQRGEYTQAVQHLERAANRIPGAPSTRYHLGMAYLRAANTEQAVDELRASLALAVAFQEAGPAREMLDRLTVTQDP